LFSNASEELDHACLFLIPARQAGIQTPQLAHSFRYVLLKMSTGHFFNALPSKEFYHLLVVSDNEAQRVVYARLKLARFFAFFCKRRDNENGV